jgi:hypothetical protein
MKNYLKNWNIMSSRTNSSNNLDFRPIVSSPPSLTRPESCDNTALKVANVSPAITGASPRTSGTPKGILKTPSRSASVEELVRAIFPPGQTPVSCSARGSVEQSPAEKSPGFDGKEGFIQHPLFKESKIFQKDRYKGFVDEWAALFIEKCPPQGHLTTFTAKALSLHFHHTFSKVLIELNKENCSMKNGEELGDSFWLYLSESLQMNDPEDYTLSIARNNVPNLTQELVHFFNKIALVKTRGFQLVETLELEEKDMIPGKNIFVELYEKGCNTKTECLEALCNAVQMDEKKMEIVKIALEAL